MEQTEAAREGRGTARSSRFPPSPRYPLLLLAAAKNTAVEGNADGRESRRRGEHVRRQLKLEPPDDCLQPWECPTTFRLPIINAPVPLNGPWASRKKNTLFNALFLYCGIHILPLSNCRPSAMEIALQTS